MSTVPREGTAFRPRKRLPTIAFASEQWEARVLATYGLNVPTFTDARARSSTRSSKGRTPPIFLLSSPRNLSFLSTSKTAKAIGVTVPPTILIRADDVIG